ncbi:MAG TPA: F0F1 ATP synthase subunit A [Bacteroidia bacterium]|nr:F0F1 ATP synthase subunit A [Bacteroidia bacterium]
MTNKITGFKGFKSLLLALCLFLVLPAYTVAAEEGKEKFNAGDMIIEHVSDAHSWHIAGNFSIPLPVILYSKDRGLMIFSSSKLRGGAVYKGLEKDPNSPNGFKESGVHIVVANPDGTVNQAETDKIWDLSITKNAATILMAGLLLILTFSSVAKGYKDRGTAAPRGVQSFFEPVVLFIRNDIAIPSIGHKKFERFMPYLLTLFFFILFLNLLGLVPFFPGGANVTGNITITMTLALFTFIIMMFNSNKTFWAHTLWMPGVPAVVKILILGPIETLGIILKPFTLLIRIFANMLAGHIVALAFFSLIFIFGAMNAAAGYGVSVVSVIFTIIMLLLDTLVALIQAYVFTLLSAMYFGMVTAEDEHH